MRVSQETILPLSLGVAAITTTTLTYAALCRRPTKTTQPQPKVILITGASSGMGKDFALTLLKRGHIVYGAARRVEQMQDIKAAGGHVLPLDVTDAGQIQTAVGIILKEQEGRIDVLINNAGYALFGAVEDVTDEEAKHQFEVNLFGLAAVTKAVLPTMRAAKSGTIINMGSMGGKMYVPFGAWYHATKHALEGWTDCLRLELQPFGIQVVLMEPGGVKTEFAAVLTEPCMQRSQGSPYEPYEQNFMETFATYEDGKSPPSLISSAIVQIVDGRSKPKRRYLIGSSAKPMVALRNWLGDAFFDSLMLGMMIKPKK